MKKINKLGDYRKMSTFGQMNFRWIGIAGASVSLSSQITFRVLRKSKENHQK